MDPKVAVGDADSLVALADKDDNNHQKAVQIGNWLVSKGYEVIYPNTAILEAITALKRAKNLPDKAELINKQYQKGTFLVEYVTEEVQQQASKRFGKAKSKQNTIFDALVMEIAKSLKSNLIFSFDKWYTKKGFKLAEAPTF